MELRELVKKEFEARVKRNPAYSLRSFARSLGTSASILSKMLNGRTEPSIETVRKLLDHLDLPEAQRKRLILKHAGAEVKVLSREEFELSPEQIALMNRWEFSAIRSLLRTRHRFSAARDVADHLGVDPRVAANCLEILVRQGLIAHQEGAWVNVAAKTCTSLNPNPNVMKILREFISLSLEAKAGPNAAFTSLSGITVETDPARFEKALERIRDFRIEMEQFLSKGTPTRVFRLNLQLFPVDLPPAELAQTGSSSFAPSESPTLNPLAHRSS